MSAETVTRAWERIEAWFAQHAPDGLTALAPGATDEAIAGAEAFLGVKLPGEVRASYLRHDGQRVGEEYNGFAMGVKEFLSLARICDEWQVWKELLDEGNFSGVHSEPDAGVCADWWNARWIPLTADGSGNNACLDLAPTENGSVGQIIAMWHDDPIRTRLALSFGAWLEGFADDLEAGEYVTHPGYTGIVQREDVYDESDEDEKEA